MIIPRYICIESFCGAGGLALGLMQAGFGVRFAFDIDKAAVATYKENLRSESAHVLDAIKLTGNAIRKCSSLDKNTVIDLFSGGPPCQGFSKQKRNAHLGDERNNLMLEFARLVRELKPRFFLLENVAMFGQKRGRKFVIEITRLLKHYEMFPQFYNCADYGLAQTRKRFIIIGRRNDVKAKFRCPKPACKRWRTVGEIIGDLPEPPEDYTEHLDYPNHQRARVTAINIERFSHVPQGGGWEDIPEELRLKCHRKVNRSNGGWKEVFGRLEWNKQCPTITGGFDSFTRGRYGHPLQDRPLTPREAARLQGFDDDFIFFGTRSDIRRLIGNAVPPVLAAAIGKEIIRSLMIADGIIEDEGDQPH